MKSALTVVGIAVVSVFGLWAWFLGPCELFWFMSAADTPARCPMK